MAAHQHDAWQLSEDGSYCRACGDSTVASPVVTVEELLIAATRRQGASHDHRKVNHARGAADALAWVVAGMPRPVAGSMLRELWEDARRSS